MTIENEVAALTTATTSLLNAVNVSKAVLDSKVEAATVKAASATESAAAALVSQGAAAGSAAQALAVYGNTAAMQTALDTAKNQASLAAASAASAGSVLQQDLSMVSGAPLHRSPNAIVAQCIYDTSLDSDGGSWVDRMSHTSWMNEPLNGAWLGQLASEAAARALPGVATGDYYQLTTNGKFYKLNAGSGTTEVFRGNKAKFPRLAAIVAEADSVTLYDLTEAGRPMWMRFVRGASSYPVQNILGHVTTTLTCVGMLNGVLSLGVNSLRLVDFIKDAARSSRTLLTNDSRWLGNISQRNTAFNVNGLGSDFNVVNESITAVAMTVLPDAPIDPATGLQIPTIAVGTAGGVSVIRSDGTVANITGFVNSPAFIYFTKDNKIASSADYSDTLWVYPIPTSSTTVSSFQEGFGYTQKGVAAGLVKTTNALAVADVYYTSKGIAKWKRNPANPTKALAAAITDKYNTGHMVGDTRRAYLANTEVESIGPAPELVTNGTFDVDTAGWAPTSGTLDAVSGELRVTSSGFSYGSANQSLPSKAMSTYECTFDARLGTSSIAWLLIFGTAPGTNEIARIAIPSGTSTRTRFSARFVATAGNIHLRAQVNNALADCTAFFDNISVKEVVPDRSSKAAGANIYGTLTKSAVATAAQLVAYSGFSATNYLQEPYSADLDFGTGEWSVGAWLNTPSALPVSSFPVIGANGWNDATTVFRGSSTKVSSGVYRLYSPDASQSDFYSSGVTSTGKTYRITITVDSVTVAGSGVGFNVGGVVFPFTGSTAPGTYSLVFKAGATSSVVQRIGGVTDIQISNVSITEVGPAILVDRSAVTGPSFKLLMDAGGAVVATAYDGTTTRTVTTANAYNTGTWLKARATYVAGKLAITVNGVEVASTVGAPLQTLNNSNAVLAIGNSRTLDAPFPGSIALLKIGATVPTPEQAAWMYEQEKQMFRDGAQITLPAATAVTDMAYDQSRDRWVAVQAGNESSFTGLVRTATATPSAGNFSKVSATSGVKLLARTTTSPGVDVTIPAYGLREELVKRGEAAAKAAKTLTSFDFDAVSFTATTTSGSAQLTAVAGVVGTPYIGMGISGTGIPAGTTIIGINGTTYTLSANATAAGTAVAMGQTDFTLPVGYTAKDVLSAGARKREGTTKDWVRLFDGFRETVRFAVSPGSAAWVQINAAKE